MPGTFNFWIDRELAPEAFAPGVRCRFAVFQLEGHRCVICSDGPTLAATLRMGAPDQLGIFRIPFSPSGKNRHLITIGWSKGTMKVYLDSKKVAEVPFEP